MNTQPDTTTEKTEETKQEQCCCFEIMGDNDQCPVHEYLGDPE